MKTKITFLKVLALVFVVCGNAQALMPSSAVAKMALRNSIPSAEVFAKIEQIKKNRKLTHEESENETLVNIGKGIGVEKFWFSGSKEYFSIASFHPEDSFDEVIQSNPSWVDPVTDIEKEKISKNRKLLEKRLVRNPYAWAWFVYHSGDKDSAKKILKDSFAKAYIETMRKTQLQVGIGGPPLKQEKLLQQALEPMSSEEEKADLKNKMREMEAKISKLPQVHVIT